MRSSFTNIVFLVILSLSIGSCKSVAPIESSIIRDSTYIEKFVIDTIPGDTIKIIGYIDCDSLLQGKLYLDSIRTEAVKLSFNQNQNRVNLEVITPEEHRTAINTDTSSSEINKEIEYIKRSRGTFEWILLISGIIFWLSIFTYIVIKIKI